MDELIRKHRKIILKHFRGRILDYAIGIKYAYCVVQEENRKAMGLAYVSYQDIYSCGVADKPSASDVFDRFSEPNMINRTLFLACINAMSQYLIWHRGVGLERMSYGNLIDHIANQIRSTDTVVVIGNMVPLVRKIRGITNKVYVFERDPRLRIEDALPDYLEYRYLEEADIVIITGVTLLNDTIDPILRYTSESALKIIVGPTAQLLPSVLLEKFDMVASLRVDNIEAVTDIIKRGGGRWSYSKFCSDYIATRL